MAKALPTTLLDFQRMFPDEGACAAYLHELRWPDGFSCPKCRVAGEAYRFQNRPTALRCQACHANTSVTAGTIMHNTKTPLQVWFWAAYLVTAQTPGMSALQFQRQLGIRRYETAFMLLHKLRAAMVRPDHEGRGHRVYRRSRRGRGWGAHAGRGTRRSSQGTVVGAVEVRRGAPEVVQEKRKRQKHEKGCPVRGETYAGRLRLRHVPNRSKLALTSFMLDSVAKDTTIFTDGWQGYEALKRLGYDHESVTLGGDPKLAAAALPLIHLVFSNLKAWLIGNHHGVQHRHLQAYLNEYVFRFNRRFYPWVCSTACWGSRLRSRPHVSSASRREMGPPKG